jgi:hypothetical protein
LSVNSELNKDTELTFGNFLPELIKKYNLWPAKSQYVFTHVSSSSELYTPFNIARDYTMIWSATHPDQKILCKHLMVLVWLAEWWDVDVSWWVFEWYRLTAQEKWYLSNGCTQQNTQATYGQVPDIS